MLSPLCLRLLSDAPREKVSDILFVYCIRQRAVPPVSVTIAQAGSKRELSLLHPEELSPPGGAWQKVPGCVAIELPDILFSPTGRPRRQWTVIATTQHVVLDALFHSSLDVGTFIDGRRGAIREVVRRMGVPFPAVFVNNPFSKYRHGL